MTESARPAAVDAAASPFHAGERAIHLRLGIQAGVEQLGRRMIRDHLPAQHRDFYAGLPYLVIGAADQTGQPWATVLCGDPGFIRAADDHTLAIRAPRSVADAPYGPLASGQAVGLLGIDLASRRRNRANGRVVETGPDQVVIRVRHTFGNCPQYITPRPLHGRLPPVTRAVRRSRSLTAQDAALIRSADTFFIASQHVGEPASGMDVSHRGGDAGFVRVDGDGTLTFPDYAGNQHFNTLGNLSLDPRAGLLFVDFTHGDLLHLAGTAHIIWDGGELAAFPHAERLLRLRVTQVVRLAGGWVWRTAR